MAKISLNSMTWDVFLASVFLFLLAVYIATVAISYWRLRHFPGPWLARFTNLWYAKIVLGGSLNTDTVALFEKYGKSFSPRRLEIVKEIEVCDKGLSSGLVRVPL